MCVVINAWPLFRTPVLCVASVTIVPIFRLLLFVVLLLLFLLSFVLLFRRSSPLSSFRSCLAPAPLSFLLSFRRFLLSFFRLLVCLLFPRPSSGFFVLLFLCSPLLFFALLFFLVFVLLFVFVFALLFWFSYRITFFLPFLLPTIIWVAPIRSCVPPLTLPLGRCPCEVPLS